MNTRDLYMRGPYWFEDRHIAEPLEEGLVLWRDDRNTVATNVPHLVIDHSPTGFEFGYGGAGPADLALNAVEAILSRIGYTGERVKCYRGTCFRLAYALHQRFKETFIEHAPRSGIVIPWFAVKNYVEVAMDNPATWGT